MAGSLSPPAAPLRREPVVEWPPMKKLEKRHTIDCDVDTFWKVFFDPEFNKELYLKALGFTKYDVLEQTDTGRRVRGTPKVNMPKPVMALIGEGFSYVEEGRFDKAGSAYRWKMTPSTMADKFKNEGSIRVEPAGEGKCTRIDEATIEAKVFGIGGMIESSTETEVASSWDKTCSFMNRWLREKKA
jgi:hypothetical protein